MRHKHYTRKQAFRLLQRLIDGRAGPASRCRALLVELLNARMSDYVASAAAQRAIEQADDHTLALFQRKLAKILEHQANLAQLGIGFRISSAAKVTVGGSENRVELSGMWENQVIIQLVTLVRGIGRERLRRCECGRLFVRQGKRQYCSLPCQKRFYMRRYRAGEE